MQKCSENCRVPPSTKRCTPANPGVEDLDVEEIETRKVKTRLKDSACDSLNTVINISTFNKIKQLREHIKNISETLNT